MAERQLITAEDIRVAIMNGQSGIVVSPRAIVTQQAREDAQKFGITLENATPESPTASPASTEKSCSVARYELPATPYVFYQTFQQQVSQMQNSHNSDGNDIRLPFEIKAQAVMPQTAATGAVAVKTCACSNKALDLASEDLFGVVRREVLAALPPSVDATLVDDLVRKALTQQGPGCGGGCLNCAQREPAAPAANGPAWLEQAPGVSHVNSRALTFPQSGPHKVGMMEVLGGAGKLSAGYVEFADTSFGWTFEKPEVLVVLEGQLTIHSGTTVLNAATGDMCAVEAGAHVTLEARGKVKYTTIATA